MKIRPNDYAYTLGCSDPENNNHPVRVVRALTAADALPALWPLQADKSGLKSGRVQVQPKGWLVEFADGKRAPWPCVGRAMHQRGDECMDDDDCKAEAAAEFRRLAMSLAREGVA